MVSQSELRDVPPWLPEHFIGGHPALDFTNTISHRLDPELAVDRFDTPDKIAGWCEFARVLDKRTTRSLRVMSDRDASMLVQRLGTLRDLAGSVLDAIADQRTVPGEALSGVLGVASDNIHNLELMRSGTGLKVQAHNLALTTDTLVGLFAMQVLDAIYCVPHSRLKACPGCRWLFFDQSRPGRRKWCDMRDCGNRAKVRRHYRRHKKVARK